MRPAWAHTCGCKSRRELVTVSFSVAQLHEGDRVWDRQAWSINRESMDKNRIEGAAKQGEQTPVCKALVTKARWRRCGDCCGEGVRSYLGISRLTPERAAVYAASEKSAEAVVVEVWGRQGGQETTKGQT